MSDDQPVKVKNKPNSVDKRKAIAMVKGGMSQTEVAKEFGVGRSAISNLIQRTEDNRTIINTYRENKPEIMEGLQAELLSAVSRDDPKGSQSLIVGAGILEDKIRLARGESTSNVALDHRMFTEYMTQRVTEMDTE